MLDAIASRLGRTIAHREALAESRHSQALAEAVFDQAPDAIELADPETLAFIQINEASCRMLGYTREDAVWLVYLEALGPHENFYRDLKR